MDKLEFLKVKHVLASLLSLRYLPDCKDCEYFKKPYPGKYGKCKGYYSYEERTLKCKHVAIIAKYFIQNYKMVNKNWVELKKVLDRCEKFLKSEVGK